MSELFKNHHNVLPFGISVFSIGAYVVSCMYNQPEVAIPSLAIGGAIILKLVRDFVEFDDMKTDMIKEAIQILKNAEES